MVNKFYFQSNVCFYFCSALAALAAVAAAARMENVVEE